MLDTHTVLVVQSYVSTVGNFTKVIIAGSRSQGSTMTQGVSGPKFSISSRATLPELHANKYCAHGKSCRHTASGPFRHARRTRLALLSRDEQSMREGRWVACTDLRA